MKNGHKIDMLVFPSSIWKWVCMTGIILLAGALPLKAESEPSSDSPRMEMTLAEAVNVVLRSNRAVKSTYLDRVVQKFDLKVARDKFNPDVDFNSSASYTGSETHTKGENRATSAGLAFSSSLTTTKRIESGGEFSFSWNRTDNLSDTNTSPEDRTGSNSWAINFTHPLLKGAGVDVNTASVILAELNEQSNILSHRGTIISTVNSTIQAFRSYAQRIRQMDIVEASLERSRASLEMNKLLISMGRMPANEIIQSESDVANQEFDYETALNEVDNARLSLINVLDLPRNTMINPKEETDLSPIHPNFDTCLKTAFENRADYLNAQMDLERTRINLVQAQDNMKWDLDFISGVSANATNKRYSSNSDTYDFAVGLNLKIPIYGDLTRKQSLLNAQTSLKKTKLNNEEIKQNITLEVQDAVREVETRLRQVGMAERSRELAEKKLSVENEKLKVGRSTNFQLVTFQNDLVDSQNAEVDAKVAYLNALTFLDTILGTTLKTWQIDYNKEYDKWPGK